MDESDRIAEQVRRYRAVRPTYEVLAGVLERVLGAAVKSLAPEAIVQVRTKQVGSFAEKIVRKAYADPLSQITDLCGARVIVRTPRAIGPVKRFLEENFDVDWGNSLDAAQKLAPEEFGYRSLHYIVQLRGDRAYALDASEQPLCRLKAEVQLRTLAEHAFADFAHDFSYKGAFPVPDSWRREIAGLAADLEQTDQAFARMEERLEAYTTSYGRYLSKEERAAEIARLTAVLSQLEADEDRPALAARIGKLAIAQEDWQRAIEVMSPFVAPEPAETNHALLRDLGVALCKLHGERGDDPDPEGFACGQKYLDRACAHQPPDPDALASHAGSWKGIDEARAHRLYEEAVEADPSDPYALGNYLEYELRSDPKRLGLARTLVGGAMQRCRNHIEVDINLPWALYDLGKFHLLRGESYESLDGYARAVEASPVVWMLSTSLRSLHALEPLRDRLGGFDWAKRLLELALVVRDPEGDEASEIARRLSRGARPLAPPVAIVAGGTDPRVQEHIDRYASLLREGFEGFRGTLIGGGTTQGVSGLVGEVAAAGSGITAIGYRPAKLPEDATPDDRYAELRETSGECFSPLEPLQAWTDLVCSGIDPARVRVVGINGGPISAAEYRIALALGATVGIIAGSGREAGKLAVDPWWMRSSRLVALPEDAQAVRAFLRDGPPTLPA